MGHALQHLNDFRSVLKHYRISDASKQILERTTLVLLAAPTSSGRNTIIRDLVASGDYHYIVSDTTRSPRSNDGLMEQNGVEYWFRSEEEMLADLTEGKLLEAAIIHNQQVSGISIRELERASAAGKIAITDIEIVGAHNIVEAKPDAIVLFVVPPTFAEWQHRLAHRGAMSSQELKNRMESAVLEFTEALKQPYYRFVINDTVAHAHKQINALAIEHRIDEKQQQAARQAVELLRTETVTWLANRA